MKKTNKLLMAVVLLAGLTAFADPVRTYERPGSNLSGLATMNILKLYDAGDEVGYRYFPTFKSENQCVKGFIKMTKSTESNAIVYTAEKVMPTCDERRFVFRDGDMMAGYWQVTPNGTNFISVAESIKNWDEKGVRPEMRLVK